MIIPKTFKLFALIDYYRQIVTALPGHRVMVDGLPCRVQSVDVDKMTVNFEVIKNG